MIDATVIIPARYGSSRYPGKPLIDIHGKPLIQHVWEAACKANLPVYVATDDERIVQAVNAFGGEAIMTGECINGTERCAVAAKALSLRGVVVNWQGDSPLVMPDWARALAWTIRDFPVEVATPVQLCSPTVADRLRADYINGTPGGTHAVFDQRFRAIFFSKVPIPARGPYYHHIGMYAYSVEALRRYAACPETPLERSEGLEQLRFLEMGIDMQCVPVSGDSVWEVNNPADVGIVAGMMEKRDAALRPKDRG